MSNRLASAASPYLQQHKDNPVDWYTWCPEALEKSRLENKPIFLSIGYSSCHWCHVMERESFSDPAVAEVLNALFVPIKVDREERPDLDHIYMQAIQMMTGSGGWPLNVFLTPDLRPFFGGTYFPPDARYGKPPFKELLRRVEAIYRAEPVEVKKNADQVTALILQNGRSFQASSVEGAKLVDKIASNVTNNFDRDCGGLGSAPKFFYSDGLRLVLRRAYRSQDQEVLSQVEHSLTRMAYGGVYDQLGGGFHRYSTDQEWKVPHFEKMLYDNALLMSLYSEASKFLNSDFFGQIATEIGEWVLREMTREDGVFYSAIDADSDHEEGLFYTWTWDELQKFFDGGTLLRLKDIVDIATDGNFEGRNIFYFKPDVTTQDRDWARDKLKSLLTLRSKRQWPLIDQKILSSWNGLMISSLARTGNILGRAAFVEAASRAADQIWKIQWQQDRLGHSAFESRQNREFFLEDAAYFGSALLDLYEVTANQKYSEWAILLGRSLLENFYDSEAHGFWATSIGQTDLLCRFKEVHDGALPSPFHKALDFCRRLNVIAGDLQFQSAYKNSLQAIAGSVVESPGGFNSLGLCLDEELNAVQWACTAEGCVPIRA